MTRTQTNFPVAIPGTQDLSPALERALGRRVLMLDRHSFDYHSSFALEELEVKLDDGTPLTLLLKDLSPGSRNDQARIKPEFLYNPGREILTYQKILSGAHLETARCYGSVIDSKRERYWLFLEKVPGVELYQIGEFDTWRRVSAWLAGMHSRLAEIAENVGAESDAAWSIYNRDFYRLWIARAVEFARQSGPHGRQARVEWVAERYDRAVDYLTALPVTFIHGEFYASNVLICQTASNLRVCPVDWEMAAWAPRLLDLAALIAGDWTEEQKTTLALDYYGAMLPRERAACDLKSLLTAVRYCRLHLAVQWLGWSPKWAPPIEHRQDWLGEAIEQAEQLAL